MKSLNSMLLFAAASLTFSQAALGQHPYSSDPDILTTIEAIPTSVTLSTAAIPSYASYRVTLTPYVRPYSETFAPVIFSATTQVVDSEESGEFDPPQYAPFAAINLPDGCVIGPTPYTTVTCTFPSPGLYSNGPAKVFTLIVGVPLATPPTPFPGNRIKISGETSWYEPGEEDGLETEPVRTAYTTLTEPDPTKFSTLLVAPANVSTGTQFCTATNGCKATAAEPFITKADVPVAGLVSIDQTKPEGPQPGGLTIGARDFFTHLDIPLLRYPPDPIVPEMLVTARIHKSQIGSGMGRPLDALRALLTKTYYWGETTDGVPSTAGYARVHLCLITGGPVQATATQPGRPCIAAIKYYTKFNAPLNPELWGTLEKKIRMRSNGRLTLPSS